MRFLMLYVYWMMPYRGPLIFNCDSVIDCKEIRQDLDAGSHYKIYEVDLDSGTIKFVEGCK